MCLIPKVGVQNYFLLRKCCLWLFLSHSAQPPFLFCEHTSLSQPHHHCSHFLSAGNFLSFLFCIIIQISSRCHFLRVAFYHVMALIYFLHSAFYCLNTSFICVLIFCSVFLITPFPHTEYKPPESRDIVSLCSQLSILS